MNYHRKPAINEALRSLIEEIVQEVMTEEVPEVLETLAPDAFAHPEREDHMVSALKKAKKKLRDTATTPNQASHEEAQIDVLINKLMNKRKGRATLSRSDMEKLDKWTRWMTFLPFGHAYRKGLAKYLRSKKDKVKHDPFKDFRRYQYDRDEDMTGIFEEFEELSPSSANKPANEEVEKFYHGTNLPNLKPGALILPPSKTGRVSEKDRKKNLDVVFFTKDPGSANIYAGRAVNSFSQGVASVYEVEPMGPRTIVNDTPGSTVYYAPYAKVLRKVDLPSRKKKNK